MQSNRIRYCMIFLVIVSLNNIAYAKEKHGNESHGKNIHSLRVLNATANPDNDILYISGDNFGKNPEIWLDDSILSIQFKSDNYIEATLPDDIEAGTYRLVVYGKKRKGKHKFAHMWDFIAPPGHMRIDKIDITIGVTGQQGEPGPIGEQGLKGDTGLQGSKGNKGDTGLQGPTGEKGDVGEIGPQGIAGPIGAQGLKGDTGLQGTTGEKGDIGHKGIDGSTGPQGPKGDTGLQGTTGSKGDKGDTGLQGIAGSTGPQGPKGDTGLQGAAGAKGDTGLQGATGDKGDPGVSGYGIVSKSVSTTLLAFGGNAYALSASCPSGKKVLGGGGKSDYNGDLLSESYPFASGSGWTIKYSNQSAYTRKISLTVYAICAECK